MTRIVLGLVALGLLSGCGIKGDLQRPDPMWNSESTIRHECAYRMAHNQPLDPRCAQYQSGVATPAPTPQPQPQVQPPASPTQPSTQPTP